MSDNVTKAELAEWFNKAGFPAIASQINRPEPQPEAITPRPLTTPELHAVGRPNVDRSDVDWSDVDRSSGLVSDENGYYYFLGKCGRLARVKSGTDEFWDASKIMWMPSPMPRWSPASYSEKDAYRNLTPAEAHNQFLVAFAHTRMGWVEADCFFKDNDIILYGCKGGYPRIRVRITEVEEGV